MRRFILDTNVVIHLIRDSQTWKSIDKTYHPLDNPNQCYLSFVIINFVNWVAFKEYFEVYSFRKGTFLITEKLICLIPFISDFAN